MHKLIVVPLLVLCCAIAMADEAPPPPTEVRLPVTNVLVAPGSAVVRREGKVAFQTGRHVLRILDLPAALRQQSLQVEMPEGVVLDRMELSLIATRQVLPQELPALEKDIAACIRLDKQLEDRKGTVGAELAMLQAFAPHSPYEKTGEGLGAPLSPTSMLILIDFIGRRTETARQQLAEIEDKLATNNAALEALQSKQQELRRNEVPARLVADLTVIARSEVEAPLAVRYGVGNVAWYPTYDFRASASGGEFLIQRQAFVAQNTGEDWNRAHLTFQTLLPQESVHLPQLRVWRIGYRGMHEAVESSHFGMNRPTREEFATLAALPAQRLHMRHDVPAEAQDLEDAFDYPDNLLADLRTPSLMGIGAKGGAGGRGGRFGARTGRGKGRALRRGGGGAQTEDAQLQGLEYLASVQRGDGSWNDTGNPQYTESLTALTLLSFLGSGHTPGMGRYQANVKKAADYLKARVNPAGRIGQGLFDQAVGAMALAETYGMTDDMDYLAPTQRLLAYLDQMLQVRMYVMIPDLHGSDYPRGVETLAFCAMAYKSAREAGVPVPGGLRQNLLVLTDQIEQDLRTTRAAASIGLTRTLLGADQKTTERYARQLLAQLPMWSPGEMHMGYFYIGTLLAFSTGTQNEVWRQWNPAMKRALLSDGAKRDWAAEDIWFGPIQSRVGIHACATSVLQVYYRYAPVHRRQSVLLATDSDTWTPVPPHVASDGRLHRFEADSLRTVRGDGQFYRVDIDNRSVKAIPRHVSTPVVYQGVFLQSGILNPFLEPLLEGTARVFLDTELLGETHLPNAQPGESLLIPLGEDPLVTVTRKIEQQVRPAPENATLRVLDVTIDLEVVNQRSDPVLLTLHDRLATSNDTRVRIRNAKLHGGQEHTLQPDGTAVWQCEVPPTQPQRVHGYYEVEYPRNVLPIATEGEPIDEDSAPEAEEDSFGAF